MAKYDLCPKCGGRKCCEAEMCVTCRSRTGRSERQRQSYLLRRARFSDLTWGSFGKNKNGRYIAAYWPDGAAKRKHLTRYQWVWMKAHGPIPYGYDVHHKNEIKDDDRLENLELKLHAEHSRHHTPTALTAAQQGEIASSALGSEPLSRKLGVSRGAVRNFRKYLAARDRLARATKEAKAGNAIVGEGGEVSELVGVWSEAEPQKVSA